MAQPLGIEPSSDALQAPAMTTFAKAGKCESKPSSRGPRAPLDFTGAILPRLDAVY